MTLLAVNRDIIILSGWLAGWLAVEDKQIILLEN